MNLNELGKELDNASGRPNQFGLLVAFARKSQKMTQQRLGELVSEREGKRVDGDAARVLISKIENNVNTPSPERVKIICDILEINTDDVKPMVESMDSYAEKMLELTTICSKLTPLALQAVLEYARQFAEYRRR